MAIINSVAVGNGQKSAGQFTYRRTRGRTIASQRVFSNKSNTAAQANQRVIFKIMSKAASSLAFAIDRAFDKTKYGSSRNNFMKMNYVPFAEVADSAWANIDGTKTPYDQMAWLFDQHIATNSEFVWCNGSGNGTVSASGTVTGADDCYSSISFKAFNTRKADCVATVIHVTNQGVTVTDATEDITEDVEAQSVSWDWSISGTSASSAVEYYWVILRTKNGVIRNPYMGAQSNTV